MTDEFSQYEVKPGDEFSQYEVKSQPNPGEAPGWFQPGSKSEALVRGFANSGTFGLAPIASSAIRSLPIVRNVEQRVSNALTGGSLMDTPRGNGSFNDKLTDYQSADKAAIQTNPGSYIGGAILGGVAPGAVIAKGAGTGINLATKVAPNLPSAARTIIGGSLGGGAAGAATGIPRGIGESPTLADIPSNIGQESKNGAIAGAIAGPLGAYLNSAKQGATAATLIGSGNKAAPVVNNSISESLKGAVTNPLLMGSANVARSRFRDENVPDWQTDPYSAAAHDATQFVYGAAAGQALKKGLPVVASIPSGVANIIASKAPQISDNAVSGTTGAGYNALMQFLNSKDVSDEDKRKAAMEAQSTPEGRALTNTDSPLND